MDAECSPRVKTVVNGSRDIIDGHLFALLTSFSELRVEACSKASLEEVSDSSISSTRLSTPFIASGLAPRDFFDQVRRKRAHAGSQRFCPADYLLLRVCVGSAHERTSRCLVREGEGDVWRWLINFAASSVVYVFSLVATMLFLRSHTTSIKTRLDLSGTSFGFSHEAIADCTLDGIGSRTNRGLEDNLLVRWSDYDRIRSQRLRAAGFTCPVDRQ